MKEIFDGYIILPARKKVVTFKDIQMAVECGTLHTSKTMAELDSGGGERVEKIVIAVQVGK